MMWTVENDRSNPVALSGPSSNEAKPLKVRILNLDILAYDGSSGAEFWIFSSQDGSRHSLK